LAVNTVRPHDGIDMIARGIWRRRIHHRAELNALHLLIPHRQDGKDGGVPRSVAIGECATRIAEAELKYDITAVHPGLPVQNIAMNGLGKGRESENAENEREPRAEVNPKRKGGAPVHNSHKAKIVREATDFDAFCGRCKIMEAIGDKGAVY
ncbi:MAG: hypothetical protein ACXWBS_07095, partial [Chthoniobacterales bacterium]